MWNGSQRLINPNAKQQFNTFKTSNVSKKKRIYKIHYNAEIMKANLFIQITLNVLIMINIEEKWYLGLKRTVGEVEIGTNK